MPLRIILAVRIARFLADSAAIKNLSVGIARGSIQQLALSVAFQLRLRLFYCFSYLSFPYLGALLSLLQQVKQHNSFTFGRFYGTCYLFSPLSLLSFVVASTTATTI